MRNRTIPILFLFLIATADSLCATGWSDSALFVQKVFVENEGQVICGADGSSDRIKYAVSAGGMDIFFTPQGLIYQHNKYESSYRVEKGENGGVVKRDKEIKEPIRQYVQMNWLGANNGTEIVAEGAVSYYFTYLDTKDPSGKSTLKAHAFKKITYKNLYPNIDVEYIFPENKSGIKYSLILRPGANPSMIKMEYLNSSGISIDGEGNAVITSSFGNIIDHAPVSFSLTITKGSLLLIQLKRML